MDVSYLLDSLNDAQREAVTCPPGHTLVLAGAGSGKTRVLVHRIAWLVRVETVSPYAVLAVTFTNKAAAEMRSRTEELLGTPPGGMWVGTFHGLAHRLLRRHWQEAGLPQAFQILDADDQYRLVRRIVREMELDEAQFPPRQVQWFINQHKDEGRRPQHLDDGGDPTERRLIAAYQRYQDACERSGQVDFAELLLRAHELWRDNPDILAHYRERFRHILVDEFQDTNPLQYAWLRLLAGTRGNLFIVGDDDQSIYGWRGARIENIHSFQQDYPDCRLVRLEQNYRSTGTILKAANALIRNNTGRLGKELWTAGADGEPIQLYAAFNEVDEARYIAARVRDAVDQGQSYRECAVLYRSNAQSRQLEEALIVERIPYRVYGGLRFFERAEIKDALSYLRLVVHRDDDPSFERVVNTPTRGVGERTVAMVRERARRDDSSLWLAASRLLQENALATRAANALRGFLELVERLDRDTEAADLGDRMEHVIAHSGLIPHHEKDKSGKGQDRVENLEELQSAASQYEPMDEDMSPVDAFLAHAALEAGEGQGASGDDCVQLMTLHSAKGLEFPLVFIAGLEEGLFPHQRSVEDPVRLEEERRLCYVGLTRAMRTLTLSFAESRRFQGMERHGLPSRFLREIPSEFIAEVRPRVSPVRPAAFTQRTWAETPSGLNLGQRVLHAKFGEGVVLNYEGQGHSARVQVNFEAVGTKWLVVSYANLQTV
ncbi:MAG: DNA helicase II [Chromatiales bacterium]|nr:DNA helicase II [Chromatiales bacterium]